ncbi:MAG: hypothetical protein WCP55_03385 [Lentisphaerota bacterium]
MNNENSFLKYDRLVSVPNELGTYLSAQQLSEDYWNNIVSADKFTQLESIANSYFNVSFALEQFYVEHKLDDLILEHPLVPRYYAVQGLFLIWSVDMDSSLDWLPNSIAQYVPTALEFKNERQMAKSSRPNHSEFCIMQVYPEDDYIFVGALKFPNWLNRSDKADLRAYYRKFWKAFMASTDKTIIMPTGSKMTQIHNELNGKSIPLEPYHKEIMQMAGFKKQPLGQYANDLIRLSPNEEVWIRVC